jgi:hypothetical protein
LLLFCIEYAVKLTLVIYLFQVRFLPDAKIINTTRRLG